MVAGAWEKTKDFLEASGVGMSVGGQSQVPFAYRLSARYPDDVSESGTLHTGHDGLVSSVAQDFGQSCDFLIDQ